MSFIGASFTLSAEDDPERPRRLPVGLPQATGGAYVFYRGVTTASQQRAQMFAGSLASPNMTGLKGRVGESLAQGLVKTGLLPDLQGWQAVTPARVGASGIDGIMLKTDARGNIRDALVIESKAFGSKPGQTSYGRQMSEQWQRKWFVDTARDYGLLKHQVERLPNPVRVRVGEPPTGAKVVLLANNRAVALSPDGSRVFYFDNGPEVALKDLRRAVSNTERYFHEMSEGRIAWRSKYFRYTSESDMHVFKLSDVDKVTGKELVGGTVIKGRYSELPKAWRQNFDKMVRQEILLARPYATVTEIESFVQKARENPEYLRTLQQKPSAPWRETMHGGLRTGAVVSVISAVGDVVSQLVASGTVDLHQTGRIAATGMLAGFVGSATSTMINYLLTPNMITRNLAAAAGSQPFLSRLSIMASGVTGIMAATALFSYLPYFMGWTDIHSANSNMAMGTTLGVGMFFAGGGALTLVTQFGVAGTGVAISGLSGAAATNAGLAALGGGTVAAGGGGMAAGGTILATTQVVGLVILAGVVAYQSWTYVTGNANQKLVIDKEFELRMDAIYSQ